MSSIISIGDFITRSGEFPVIDVRSESEYRQGHFPGAINIPILNDEHRKEVGITYKQKGRQEAVLKGFDLVGGKFGDFIREVKQIPGSNHPTASLLLYCWRGGMRSAIADWVLSLAGLRVLRLKGGYKKFRNWAIDTLKQEKNILVLGGMTGSGKTEILHHLSKLGETVIDLEQFAHHKGSAFGGLGQLPQPTNEHFENMLALEWAKIADLSSETGPQPAFAWLENESRTIGHNQIPNPVYEQIRNAKVIEIVIPREKRIERILDEYGHFSLEQLEETTKKLKKRLGGQHLKESLEYLANHDLKNWAVKMLDYYDKAYSYGMSLRAAESVHIIHLDGEDYFEMAKQVSHISKDVMKKTGKKELSL